jgi:hypothetical protein
LKLLRDDRLLSVRNTLAGTVEGFRAGIDESLQLVNDAPPTAVGLRGRLRHGRHRRLVTSDQRRGGAFGFQLEMGRDHGGIRMQARRTGFVTERAATIEYDRLCQQRDARHRKPRLSDSVQNICEDWVLARELVLEPNTVYGYRWLLGLIYPYVGGVRASSSVPEWSNAPTASWKGAATPVRPCGR